MRSVPNVWPPPDRQKRDWQPFMDGLVSKMRREKRRRTIFRLAAAAALLLAVGIVWQVHFAEERGSLLHAAVPSSMMVY